MGAFEKEATKRVDRKDVFRILKWTYQNYFTIKNCTTIAYHIFCSRKIRTILKFQFACFPNNPRVLVRCIPKKHNRNWISNIFWLLATTLFFGDSIRPAYLHGSIRCFVIGQRVGSGRLNNLCILFRVTSIPPEVELFVMEKEAVRKGHIFPDIFIDWFVYQFIFQLPA